jgi:hypothetical protein
LPQATAEHFVIIGDQNTYHKSFPLSLVGYLSCVLANSSFRRKRFSASSGAKENYLRHILRERGSGPRCFIQNLKAGALVNGARARSFRIAKSSSTRAVKAVLLFHLVEALRTA